MRTKAFLRKAKDGEFFAYIVKGNEAICYSFEDGCHFKPEISYLRNSRPMVWGHFKTLLSYLYNRYDKSIILGNRVGKWII